MKTVIVTGGSGYIGKAICNDLLKKGYAVINLDKVKTDKFLNTLHYHQIKVDLENLNSTGLAKLVRNIDADLHIEGNYDQDYTVAGIIHMAAYKDIEESILDPILYYNNNLVSTINTLYLAHLLDAKTFIFSSSAAVYPEDIEGAVSELDTEVCTTKDIAPSPYGYTKFVAERIILETCRKYKIPSYCLRYQNPIGCVPGITADESNSMFGNILNSIKNGTTFSIFGDDYDTPDGTCIRDYIDIKDISEIHCKFLELPESLRDVRGDIVNVGIGRPLSCLEVCKIVQKLYSEFKWNIGPRRLGDAAGSYACITKLNCRYNIKTSISIEDSIIDIITQAKL